MEKIPLYLLTGFLGSGKTTLLKRIIRNSGKKQRIGVIQNEFAPANVDGEDLKSTGKPFEILEINNGSIFCICLVHDFKTSLLAFIEKKKPDMIFIETSGLADPMSVTEIMQEDKIFEKIQLMGALCIVDALNFGKAYPRMIRLTHQVLIADRILINKADLVSSDEIDSLKKHLLSINPLAQIDITSFCEIDTDTLKKDPSRPAQALSSKLINSAKESTTSGIKPAVFRSGRSISLKNLDTVLEKYKKNAYRIKGFVKLDDHKTAIVQSVNGNLYLDKQDKLLGSTVLVLLGKNFSLSNFSRDFRTLTN